MRKRGFEPLRLKSHWTLNPARLPVPPLPLIQIRIYPVVFYCQVSKELYNEYQKYDKRKGERYWF